jgi:hypothetical protein
VRYVTVLASAVALSAALCGCATPEVQKTERFGQAVESAKAAQILHPQAASSDAAGMDGASTHETMQRYRDSFKAPPPTFVIINAAPGGGAR